MFNFKKTAIPEVILVEPSVFSDERGYFMESYKFSDFFANGIKDVFTQDNHSYSRGGVLRGLHYQLGEFAQAKLVRCVRGEIFDVAVDMRPDSSTRFHYVAYTLSAENKRELYIPAGFAHGFCVTSEEAEVVYKCSVEYKPDSEHGIIWNDPTLNISWPISNPILSAKDMGYPNVR